MKLSKIIWLNLVLEWAGVLRILGKQPNAFHQADIELFKNGHQKIHYILNWVMWKIGFKARNNNEKTNT